MFTSDIASVAGTQVERKWLLPPAEATVLPTRLCLAPEEPTPNDWAKWSSFWLVYLGVGLALHEPLGPWTNKSSRIWEWFYIPSEEAVAHFGPHHGTRRSRKRQYTRTMRSWLVAEANTQPCSIGHRVEDTVLLLSTEPVQVQPNSTPQSLVDLLCSREGKWM